MQNPNETVGVPEILQRLDEILFWLRASSFSSVRKHLEEVLDSEDKRRAYQLTDGVNTMADIRNHVDVAHGTLQAWWTDWEAKGIVRESPQRKGRKQRLIDLKAIGLG
jgi:hypothetical protein